LRPICVQPQHIEKKAFFYGADAADGSDAKFRISRHTTHTAFNGGDDELSEVAI